MKPPLARAASSTVVRSAPPPALWHDPLALALAVLALPLVLHSLSTPLGEPFADDFAFLRRALFPGPRSWLDGGGSPISWRPLGIGPPRSLVAASNHSDGELPRSPLVPFRETTATHHTGTNTLAEPHPQEREP